MFSAERRQIIANLIQQQSTVRVKDLCARFAASESTIRRDLEHLERQGILERTYGGAVAAADTAVASPAINTPAPATMRIGSATANLIAEGETIFIGPGTTYAGTLNPWQRLQPIAHRIHIDTEETGTNKRAHRGANQRLRYMFQRAIDAHRT